MVNEQSFSERQKQEDDRVLLTFLLPLGAVVAVGIIMVSMGTLFLSLEKSATFIVDLALMISTMALASFLAAAFPTRDTGPQVDVVTQRMDNYAEILRAQVDTLDPLVERCSAEALACAERQSPVAGSFALAAAAQRVLDLAAYTLQQFDHGAARELRTAGSTTAQAEALVRVLRNDQFLIEASRAAERQGYAASTARPELADHCSTLLSYFRLCHTEGGHPVLPREEELQAVKSQVNEFPRAAMPLLRLVSAMERDLHGTMAPPH